MSAEVYKENNIAIWDVAAGLAIVKAAGGKIYFHFEQNDCIQTFKPSKFLFSPIFE